jgi:hypothetical protein
MNTSETTPTSLPSAAMPLPCRYLRCKEMYYQGSEDDAFAGGAYWCNRTQEPFGPDGEPCGKKECCANRTCYVT